MNTCFWPALFVASAFAIASAPTAVRAGSLNGIGDWQDGEIGNTLGAVTADASGPPRASERLYSMTHDPAAMRDTGAPATFAAPVAPLAGYSAHYYYGRYGSGYYMGGLSPR